MSNFDDLSFDRHAEMFLADTGIFPPGKDQPATEPEQNVHDVQRWAFDSWCKDQRHIEHLTQTIDKFVHISSEYIAGNPV